MLGIIFNSLLKDYLTMPENHTNEVDLLTRIRDIVIYSMPIYNKQLHSIGIKKI